MEPCLGWLNYSRVGLGRLLVNDVVGADDGDREAGVGDGTGRFEGQHSDNADAGEDVAISHIADRLADRGTTGFFVDVGDVGSVISVIVNSSGSRQGELIVGATSGPAGVGVALFSQDGT